MESSMLDSFSCIFHSKILLSLSVISKCTFKSLIPALDVASLYQRESPLRRVKLSGISSPTVSEPTPVASASVLCSVLTQTEIHVVTDQEVGGTAACPLVQTLQCSYLQLAYAS